MLKFVLCVGFLIVLIAWWRSRRISNTYSNSFRFHSNHWNEAEYKGKKGENEISERLRRMGEEYRVFDDVMVKCSWGTAQIDHIVVSKYGIFVVETKNYQGKIYGGEHSENWKQYLHGREFKMVNPVRQNKGHIRALVENLPTYNQFQYMSLVVFAGWGEVKTNCKNVVYDYDITRYIRDNRKDEMLTEVQVDEYCKKLEEINIVDEEIRSEHKLMMMAEK